MSTRGALTFLACVAFASAAHAQVECSPAAVGCHVEDVDFEHRDGLFDSVDFDTGWVPAGSPLQVRFGVMLGGATRVEMGGTSRTSCRRRSRRRCSAARAPGGSRWTSGSR